MVVNTRLCGNKLEANAHIRQNKPNNKNIITSYIVLNFIMAAFFIIKYDMRYINV